MQEVGISSTESQSNTNSLSSSPYTSVSNGKPSPVVPPNRISPLPQPREVVTSFNSIVTDVTGKVGEIGTKLKGTKYFPLNNRA